MRDVHVTQGMRPTGGRASMMRFARRPIILTRAGVALGLLALFLVALALTACSPGIASTTTGGEPMAPPGSEAALLAVPALSTQSAGTAQYPIKIYFSKFSDASPNAVYAVNRVSPTIGVATYALQLLIAGPTPEERAAGYYSEFNSILTGPSSCSAPRPTGGPDFTLALNTRGSTTEQGTATMRLCRATSVPGVGAEARVRAQIESTLKQFPAVKKAVVLTKDGHCFGDASGQDLCLR